MSELERLLRRGTLALTRTPLHPQWLSFRTKRHAAASVGALAHGRVLDVGCAGGALRQYLAPTCVYVGLDYPTTAASMYGTRPTVFGDAEVLPFADASFDVVAILDVLEHLPDPQACLGETRRVLSERGIVLAHVPFLYPLHDEPFDFWRLTRYGLQRIFQNAGLRIETIRSEGAPAETAALLLNLALARLVLRAANVFAPAVVLAVAVAPLILLTNCLGWLVGRVTQSDAFMPVSYWVHATPASHISSEVGGSG